MVYRVVLVVLATLALGYLYAARAIELDPWSEQDLVTAKTLPFVYGILLLLSIAVLAFRKVPKHDVPRNVGPTLALIILISICIYALPFVGLWGSMALLLFSGSLTLANERTVGTFVSAAAVACVVPTLGWLLVEKFLEVAIPL